MFKENELTKELCYETEKRKYYLYEGYTNNGFKSDIVFIIYLSDSFTTVLVDFIYGGFDNRQGIEETIKCYEEKEILDYE